MLNNLMLVAVLITSQYPLMSSSNDSGVMEGWATHYADTVMENTIYTQTYVLNHLPEDIDFDFFEGFIASPDCSRIGEIAYISHNERPFSPYLVVDCAGANSIVEGGITWMERDNVLAEVDWDTCVRWDTCGGGTRIRMYYHPYLTAWDYPTSNSDKLIVDIAFHRKKSPVRIWVEDPRLSVELPQSCDRRNQPDNVFALIC